MFRAIDVDSADFRLRGTYPAIGSIGPRAVLYGEADTVVGTRLERHHGTAERRFHGIDDHLIRGKQSRLFDTSLADVLSGYRPTKPGRSMPALSQTLSAETEMTNPSTPSTSSDARLGQQPRPGQAAR